MRASDYIRLAFGNLWRQKVRSALTIFAIVIGATSVTIMLSLLVGIKGFFLEQFNKNGEVRQIVVTQATDLNYVQAQYSGTTESGIKLNDALFEDIKQIPHVENATPTTGVYVFDALIFAGKTLSVQGPQAYDPNGVIKKEVVAGRDLQASDGAGTITLTTTYADKLGYKGKYDQLIGQTITLKTNKYFKGQGASLPAGVQQEVATELPATVVGVVSPTISQEALYFPLSWARGLLEQRHYQSDRGRTRIVTENILDKQGYQTFVVSVDNTKHVKHVADAITAKGLGASTAESFIKQQTAVFTILSLVLAGIGGIALLVAAVGVINTMLMAILERTHEIGIMRAVGARRATIRRLFIIEAAVLGGLGGALGLLAGYGLIVLANPLINEQLTVNSIQASNIIYLPLWLVLAVMIITVGIGIVAGLYPAHRAARLKPVDALRHE